MRRRKPDIWDSTLVMSRWRRKYPLGSTAAESTKAHVVSEPDLWTQEQFDDRED